MIKNIIIAAIAIASMVSCQEDNSADINTEVNSGATTSVATFKASEISTRVTTDDTDNYLWESGDKIGISTSGFTSYNYTNKEYVVTTTIESATTSFAAVNSEIIFDEDGDITFSAYYPYTTDQSVTIDLSDQSNTDDAIFLTATTTQSISQGESNEDIIFEFKHLLSKVTLNITFDDDVSDISYISATLMDVIANQTYDLSGQIIGSLSPDNIEMLTTTLNSDSRSGVITAILHPTSLASTSYIRFNIAGDIYNLPYSEALESGKEYIYDVTISEANDIKSDARQ